MAYETYYERYKKLRSTYDIVTSTYNLSDERFKQADVVVVHDSTGYAHKNYKVLKNKPNLSALDLAIICDSGNLCFGYRVRGNIITVHTD